MNQRLVQALWDIAGPPPASQATEALPDAALLTRFHATQDPAAFAEITRRHGPMVWAVCRQLLRNHADAEDAFQATFLALVQSANRIRSRDNLGAWLYGVAVRVSTKLKRSAVRRHQREQRVATPDASDTVPDSTWNELHSILHEEVQRLPTAMRSAFVLCELQGVSATDAAKQLSCKSSTLAVRLSKARQRLLDRLTQRDLAPAVAVGLMTAFATTSTALVPHRLMSLLQAFPKLPNSELPTLPLELAQEIMPMFPTPKFLLTAALCISVSALSVGYVLLPTAVAKNDPPQPVAAAAPQAKPAAPVEKPKLTGSTISGTITLPDGTPAKGAIVWVALFNHGPLVHHEMTIGADGKYELPVTEGQWSVSARRDSLGGEGTMSNGAPRMEVLTSTTQLRADIRLEERGTFEGQLLQAETGKPIAAGKLYLDNGVVLTTDVEGRFSVGGLKRKDHELFVVATGRLRQRVLFDTTANAKTVLEIPVAAAPKIVGRVTDANGKPIPGASVSHYTSGDVYSMKGLFAACQPDGTFEYDDAMTAGGPSQLAAYAPGYITDVLENLSTSFDKPLTVNFKLTKTPEHGSTQTASGQQKRRIVSGTVHDPDGKPIEGVHVRWGFLDLVGSTTTKTDAKGQYRMTVPDEPDGVAILSNQHEPEFITLTQPGDQTTKSTLKKGHIVKGQVTDDDGKPIQGVLVLPEIDPPAPNMVAVFSMSELAAWTDANGRYELRGIPNNALFTMLKSGLTEWRQQELALDGVENKTTLRYGGAVKGRVVDKHGKPIQNFRVTVNGPHERVPGDQSSGYFTGYCGIGVRFTAADGSFVLTGVGANDILRVQVYAAGHGEAVVDRVKAVPLNKLDQTEPTTIRATDARPLKFKLFSATTKKPIAKARVTLVNGQPQLDQRIHWGYDDACWEYSVRAESDGDGEANFPALPFSGATVLVRAPGFARQQFGWRDKAAEIKVDMQPESVIIGKVNIPPAGDRKSLRVQLESAQNDHITLDIMPDAKGQFRIGELPARTWALSVIETNGKRYSRTKQIVLKVGETKEVTVDLDQSR